jgi:hypothetical protein
MIKKTCQYCQKTFYVYPYRKSGAAFCSRACGSLSKTGKNHNAWKGGRNKMKNGYIRIRVDKKYMYEHRFVMEKHLGRPLQQKEVVHHIDGDRTNNRIENLCLMPKKKHDKIETISRWRNNPGSFRPQKSE